MIALEIGVISTSLSFETKAYSRDKLSLWFINQVITILICRQVHILHQSSVSDISQEKSFGTPTKLSFKLTLFQNNLMIENKSFDAILVHIQ